MNSGDPNDGDSDMALACTCRLGVGRAQQRTIAYASTSLWEKAAPLTLALKPENSVSPFMSLAPFKLLP